MRIVRWQDIEGKIPVCGAFATSIPRSDVLGAHYLQTAEKVYGNGYRLVRKDCTVQSIARVLDIDYELALDHLMRWGFDDGMNAREITDAINDALMGSPSACKFTPYRRTRLTVAALLTAGALSKRTIIGTPKHVFPVINGTIYDWHRAVARCTVKETWEIVPREQVAPM